VIDDVEDIQYCSYNPLIYLKNKLKADLAEDEKLRVILITKKDTTVNALFNNQLTCDASFQMPLVTSREEVFELVRLLKFKLTLSDYKNTTMNTALIIKEVLSSLVTFCNKNKTEAKSVDDFLEYLNAAYSKGSKGHGFFQEKGKMEPFVGQRISTIEKNY
jgi:hypothetical protein